VISRLRRGTAVFGNNEVKVAHVRVARGEEDTLVGGQAGQDQRPHVQVLEKRVEGRGEKCGMLGLENEVVGFLRSQQLCKWSSANVVRQAVLEQHSKVRSPLSEVVVDIDDGNVLLSRAPGEGTQALRHWESVLEYPVASVELEIVYHVDDHESDR
jgi:hypothetical protein